MNTVEGLVTDEALEPQRKLARRERSLASQTTRAEAFDVIRQRVLGSVDDSQVLRYPALYGPGARPHMMSGTEAG